ncbi:hypothetical protein AB595_04135 [Massilia sp. WF1]|nr:hypothetical protein AM586_12015 [Massilia sp. WG5]KLU38223.1 hypothetical protein AB595_04135 [Massilia sp. WF1]
MYGLLSTQGGTARAFFAAALRARPQPPTMTLTDITARIDRPPTPLRHGGITAMPAAAATLTEVR